MAHAEDVLAPQSGLATQSFIALSSFKAGSLLHQQ